MAKAHGGKSGKEGARAPNPAGVVTVRESFRADQTPRMRHVAFSAKEIEASIGAVKGPPLKGGPTKAEAKRHAVPIDPVRAGGIGRKDGSERQAKAMAAFDKLIQERPVLGPGMQEEALERARDQYCLIGKRLVEFFFADESINSATLADDIERSLRRALAQMDEDKQRRLIAALMALAGELQSARVLSTVPPQRLTRVALLIGQAHATAIEDPTAMQREHLATVIEYGADEERDGPPLWRDREVDPKSGKRPTVIEWFDLHWRPLVLAGAATGDDIRREDPTFYSNWASALSKRGQKVGDFVPPSPTRGKKNETAEERAERLRRHVRESRRRAKGRSDEQQLPTLFEQREADASGKMPTALEWFETHWKQRVADEGLRSDDLKAADLKLYNALASIQSHKGASLGDLIPLSLKRQADMTDEEKAARHARRNELSAARMRRYRGSAPK